MATILIADDVASMRRVLYFTLRTQHTVIEAEDGEQALRLVERHRPELVILDVAMPHMDGLEVCRRIRASPDLRHIGVIILSASSLPAEARRAGADVYLEKPCRPSRIRATVEDLLRGRDDNQAENDDPARS